MARSNTAIFLALLLTLAGACRNPSGPDVDPADVISFRPVSDIRIDKVLTPTVVVTYAEPIADGGVPPLTVKCNPPSGSDFRAGTTIVTCSASDGVRTAETHFTVTLVPVVPVISATKFLAFGDSITRGAIDTNPLPTIQEAEVDESRSYPAVLQGLLRARYTDQTMTVINEGAQGEFAIGATSRLDFVLRTHRPQALLLLEGANDITLAPPQVPNIQGIINALRNDIAAARSMNVQVFLSTLTPKKPAGGVPRYDDGLEWVIPTNDAIKNLAIEQNVVLVDSYAAMIGNAPLLIGGDGLHPTAEGMVVLAETFMKAIREKLELPPGSTVPASASPFFKRPR